MKKIFAFTFTLIIAVAMLAMSASAAEYYEYTSPYCATAPAIDGVIGDGEWDGAEWAACTHTDHNTTAANSAYSAKFKVMHDDEYVYFLFEVVDGSQSDWDNVGVMISDVRDEDADDAPISTTKDQLAFRHNGRAIEPMIYPDSSSPAEAQAGSLVEYLEGEWIYNETGYVCEFKVEFREARPESVYFNATWGETSAGSELAWNPYWANGTHVVLSTRCYGTLKFAAKPATAPEDNTEAPNTFDAALMVAAVALVSGAGVVVSKKVRR